MCNRKKVAQDRDSWKKTVEHARSLQRLQRFIRRRRRRLFVELNSVLEDIRLGELYSKAEKLV